MVRRLIIPAIVIGLLIGGWYWNRSSERTEERNRLLRLASSNRPAALDELMRSTASHPDDFELLWATLDFRLRCVPDHASIESDLDRYLELQPNDLVARRSRMARRAARGLHDDALDDALRVAKLAPDDAAAHIAIVNLCQSTGRLGDAIPSLEGLLALRPDSREEFGELLAKAYWETGQAARARAALENNVSPTSERPMAKLIRGLLCVEDRRHDEAVRLLREAARPPEQRSVALYHLSQALRAADRTTEARSTLRELEQVKERERLLADARQRAFDTDLQVRAARAMLLEDRPREAAVLIEAAIARHGVRDEFREPLAEAYRKLGRSDLASQWQKKSRR